MPFIKKIFHKTIRFVVRHKIVAGFFVLAIGGVGYWTYHALISTNGSVSYVLGRVQRGTIVASVSASGQVSTSNQIDIKPKASGDVTWVGIKAGDTIHAGQALAYIDATAAKQTIADAEASLVEAKLQYQKNSAQAPIDYEKSVEALEDAKTNLNTVYNDTYNTLSNAYLDLPGVVTGAQNILYGYDLSGQTNRQWNIDELRNSTTDLNSSARIFADIAERDYKTSRTKYDQAVLDYKMLTRYSAREEQEKLMTLSIDTTTAIAQTLQSELNLLDAVIDDTTTHGRIVNSTITSMRVNARNYLSTTNSNLSALLIQQKLLDSTKKTIRDNERNIEIYKIGNPEGDNPISLQSSAQALSNQERNLQELKNNLAYYTISAPFDGTIASLNLKRFDTVSTGSTVAALITNQKIAQLSLNEVDATKINLGDKATLTFDAIENLTLTGEVAEIDAVGTVAQGVVSYKVKIGFDSQDERIKSGMTVNASIQTDVRQDILTIPSSAVKTQNSISFVRMFSPELSETGGIQGIVSSIVPEQVEVRIGISDDTKVEILSGLEENQQIVIRTISWTTVSATTPTNGGGGLGVPGVRF